MLQLSPIAASLLNVLLVAVLLLNFVLLGSRWLKNYVWAFALESWLIAVLALAVAYFSGFKDLYVVGLLTLVFRGVILPCLLTRMINKLNMQREMHSLIPPSTSLILCILLVILAFIVATQLAKLLQLSDPVICLALMVMLAVKLIGFFLLAVRDQAISKVLALLVIENGIFLGSLFLVPGMPMFIELVILFDLLIVVASFGVLVDHLTSQIGSTSTHELQRLVG